MASPHNDEAYQATVPTGDMIAFHEALEECFADPGVAGYFERGYVVKSEVALIMLTGMRLDLVLAVTGYSDLVQARADHQETRDDKIADFRASVSDKYAVVGVLSLLIAAVSILGAWIADSGLDVPWYTMVTLLGGGSILTAGLQASSVLWGAIPWEPRLVAQLSILGVVLPAVLLTVGHSVLHLPSPPLALIFCWIGCLIMGVLGKRPDAKENAVRILEGGTLPFELMMDSRALARIEQNWRSELPEHLLPYVRQIITKQLGEQIDFLLVEQDATGLRRIRDPRYVVRTGSEDRVRSRLKQVNGGTIALAGQRGSGKSTVLNEIVQHGRTGDHRRLSVVVQAPTEYEPREFLLNLFQEVCEKYLRAVNYSRHDAMLAHVVTTKERLRRFWAGSRSAFYVVLLAALAVFGAVNLVRDVQAAPSVERFVNGAADVMARIWTWVGQVWQENRQLLALALLVASSFLLRKRLRRRPPRSPNLAEQASQYLYQIRLNHTLNRGVTATLAVAKGGPALGLNRVRSLSIAPFTFPELVGHLRGFLEAVAKEGAQRGPSVYIGIDEVDRMGSADQVERFVRDVKTIFDIEDCYFLITVADDVGALFARRAVSGSNVFDTAFDDVIEIEPLRQREARDLLQRRAAGFTDPFACLLFSLSGGFPRELMRLARRLVDLNQQANDRVGISGDLPPSELVKLAPKLHDLTVMLVKDELIQVVSAVRRQLAAQSVQGWTGLNERLRQLVHRLSEPPAVAPELPDLLADELRTLAAWLSAPRFRGAGTESADTEQTLRGLGAYLSFAATILDAFSATVFAREATRATAGTGQGSFEHLAAARREIGVSPDSSRAMVTNFRSAWQLPDIAVGCSGNVTAPEGIGHAVSPAG